MQQIKVLLLGLFIILMAGYSDTGHLHDDNSHRHTPNKHDSIN